MSHDDWGSHVISPAPVKGKPFKASYEQVRSEVLLGGQIVRRTLRGAVCRDADGRARQELHIPNGDAGSIRVVFITNHARGVLYVLDADSQTYVEERFAAAGVAGDSLPSIGQRSPARDEDQDLGRRRIEGLDCRGYRSSAENAAVEVWYSEELGVALLEKRTAASGEHTLRLFGVQRTEPQSEWFVVPTGYARAGEGVTGAALLSPAGAADEAQYGADLNLATARGDVDAVQFLLHRGGDVNARGHHEETALMAAAECGHAALVALLLDADAEVELRSKAGMTALMHAALNGHSEVVRALLARGAQTDAEGGRQTPLMLAATGGHAEVVGLLLAAGADVNARESHGMTALMFAAASGSLPVTQALLAAGADLKVKNADGYTALEIASLAEQSEIARVLEEDESAA